MASGIKVAEFIGVERTLVRDALQRAPQTLTAADREWVPTVARDNFDRSLQARSGSLGKDEFLRTFTRYLAAQAHKADRSKNGTLSALESKRLPADLGDNFKDAQRVSKGVDWKQATEEVLANAGRKALRRYVTRVLFNPKNPEGASFRSEVLGHLSLAEREQRRQALLAEAAAWSPANPGWSQGDWDTRTLVAEGRFGGLYANLFFEKGLPLPRVYLEVDCPPSVQVGVNPEVLEVLRHLPLQGLDVLLGEPALQGAEHDANHVLCAIRSDLQVLCHPPGELLGA